jgi:hypothetical protein
MVNRNIGLCLAVVLVLLLPAAAQVGVGDLDMKGSGLVSADYNGDYGNQMESSHGLGLGGAASLAGSYYNPNFLNFNLSPYYNQSRANSQYQSISDASGFNSGVGIFSGSNFPGSINFAQSYNSEGNFGVPGLANYTTQGDSQTFGINWGEHVPDMPTLSAFYQRGSNEYSIYGANENGSSKFQGFGVNSGYSLAGFGLGAFYSDSVSHSLIPQVLDSQGTETSQSNSDAFGFSATHALPMHGSWSAVFSRSDFDSDLEGYGYNGIIDTLDTNAGAQPTAKLHLSVSADYSSNLTGTLYESLIPAGSASLLTVPNQNQPSHSLDIMGSASYALLPNLQAQAFAERREQYFLGENFTSNSYGGGASCGRKLAGGNFNAVVNVFDTTNDNTNSNTLAFTTTANYNRHIGLWNVSGAFSYAQNANTLLVTYTTSNYSFSGSASRSFGRLLWTGSASFARSGLTNQPDTKSASQSYSTSIGYRQWITLSGAYSDSSGNGLLTAAGLTTTPLPVIVPSSVLTLYSGKGYSVGLGSSLARRLTVGASFADATSNTMNQGIGSWNQNQVATALVQYQFRQMGFTAGYSRLLQGFSASGLPPALVTSYSVGISRWFNFF